MKKILIFLFLCFCSLAIASANERTHSFSINWHGVEHHSINRTEYPFLAFDHATYFSRTPYIMVKLSVAGKENPKYDIQNIHFETLTSEELDVLSTLEVSPTAQPTIVSTIADGESNVRISPFVCKDGKWFKIVSFDIKESFSTRSFYTKAIDGNSYATNSAMKSGKWVRMTVPSSGIYCLTYDMIVSAGIDPADVHIYGYGGNLVDENFGHAIIDDLPQVPYYINKGADGVFNKGDYILFYGRGPISWKKEPYNIEFKRIRNPYSNEGHYFLSSGNGEPVQAMPLIEKPDVQSAGSISTFDCFLDHYLIEKDEVSICNVGRELFGDTFNSSTTLRNYTFNVPNIALGRDARVRLNAATYTQTDRNENCASFILNINGVQQREITPPKVYSSDYYTKATEADALFDIKPSTSNIPVSINYITKINTSKAWLNYLTLTVYRYMVMTGTQMEFRIPEFLAGMARFPLKESNENVQIWDISSYETTKHVETEYNNGTTTFYRENLTGELYEYVAVDVSQSNYPRPTIKGAVSTQNLHGEDTPDMVIIANSDYLDAAYRIADVHEQEEGLISLVVTPEEVYNEFSSGTPDATAYRKIMKLFYDRSKANPTGRQTKYLLLLGDGTFDNRQQVHSPDGMNKLLTYQTQNSLNVTKGFVVDDYFAFMDDMGSGDDFCYTALPDIGVGRIPVHTVEDANAVANKIVRYVQNNDPEKWRSQLLFLSDDGDCDRHIRQCDTVACRAQNFFPNLHTNKLYLDSYKQTTTSSGESYPEAKQKLIKMLTEGVLYFNYVGHGGYDAITNEVVLSMTDVENFRNEHLGFWMTATCDFFPFDEERLSIGDKALNNPHGGAIALFASTRTVYADPNHDLNKAFIMHILKNDANNRVGDAVRLAKKECKSYQYENKLGFLLFGDPALHLHIPPQEVSTISINGQAPTEAVVGALDMMKIEGAVMDITNTNIDKDFNGIVHISIYDKTKTIKTLGNDDAICGVYRYKDRSGIFAGKAEVKDGKFALSLLIPKEIDFNMGDAQILYYAYDKERQTEAYGNQLFAFGGFTEREISDEEGPLVNMYLNTSTFRNGDTVKPNCAFVAHVSDDSGINISSAGIGHDIALKIDDGEWLILNDSYEANIGSFTDGVVKLNLTNLALGKHQLTFRVWDLLNNSTVETLTFNVSENAEIKVRDAFCYPNPASEQVTFMFRHDRPDEFLSVKVTLFDMTGKKMWSASRSEISVPMDEDGNRTVVFDWDLRLSNGAKLNSGLYLYVMEISGETGNEVTKANKLVVK